MGRIVTVVICAVIAVGAPVARAVRPVGLLRVASQRSGLAVRRPVPVAAERASVFETRIRRAFDQNYPPALQNVDDVLGVGLGLMQGQRPMLLAAVRSLNTWYDPASGVLHVRRGPAATRADRLRGLVRALIDQNFGLRRLGGLRERDRDAALAAEGVVDGVASLAAGLRPRPLTGSPLQRFLAEERTVGVGPGRSLVATLRALGGRFAVASALRTLPRTTEQLLHVDKLLEREPALPVPVARQVADLRLATAETFGELDVRALLRAFGIGSADSVADGWGGGRLALYLPPTGDPTVALALRWDTSDDATEWQTAVPAFVSAAFPAATPAACPAVSGCWLDGPRELAFAIHGRTTTFGSGPAGELVAATLAQG